MKGSERRLLLDTILLGIVGALGAEIFMLLLRVANALLLGAVAGYKPPGLPEEGGVLTESIGPQRPPADPV